MLVRTAPLAALLPLLAACDAAPIDPPHAEQPPAESVPADDVLADRLFDGLVGSFDSARQSEEDPRYFAISLVACAVDAPDLGERVLYLEQARLDALDQPYRQRLYVVDADDAAGEGWTRIYALANPAAAVGQCEDPAVASYAADQVDEREGCGVRVAWDADGERFVGGTEGTDCASTLGGASWATSEVTITADRIDSWDRGFSDDGQQAWGAEAGPYLFDRLD